MNFLELVKTRQSVRKYDASRAVGKEKIEKCIEAARLAPSACNSQPWTFIVVDDKKLVKDVAKATFSQVVSFNKFAVDAPVIVLIVIEKPKIITQIGEVMKNREFPLLDIGIAAEHFCLQAHEQGLGTCMMGWFNEKKIMQLLGIPAKKRIGLCISLGYPVDGYYFREKIRKDTDKICKFNSY